MHTIAAVDEVATETQLSAGWTYALFSSTSIDAIDAAVKNCEVKQFHGKRFKKSQESDYRALLAACRRELERSESSFLGFTLNNLSWKADLVPFAERMISNAMSLAGVIDPSVLLIGEHLFPGMITLQRLTNGSSADSIEIEIDSDDISKLLKSSAAKVRGHSVPTARLLTFAYNAYRMQQFPHSPELAIGGLRALKDANSRAIQVADVFGNFALAYVFVHLGQTSKTRGVKAKILEDIFGDVLDPRQVAATCTLVGDNDIQVNQPGALTLCIGCLRDAGNQRHTSPAFD